MDKFFAAFALMILAGSTGAAFLSGCGSDNNDNNNGSTGETGASLYAANCASCHGSKAAGGQGPNITGSMSAGIGGWSFDDFSNAVRNGIDDENEMLCDTMPHFPASQISDAQLTKIHDFLLTQMSDTANDGTSCP